MSGWVADQLTTTPPVFVMGHNDKLSIPITAEEPVNSCDATLYWPIRNEYLEPPLGVAVSSPNATVVVDGSVIELRRGETYEIQLEWTSVGGKKWTRKINLEIKA